MMKRAIVTGLGEGKLLLPDLVDEALAANTRAKYFLTLLQLACAHADMPDLAAQDLRTERELAGIGEKQFDEVITESRTLGDHYRIPHAGRVIEQLLADIRAMISPLRAADDPTATSFERRLAAIAGRVPKSESGMSRATLVLLTSSDDARGDSAHRLILDLHKAVDELVAALATEDIDGAKGYRLTPDDRGLLASFMSGVRRTQAARLGHPGLGTTATRNGAQLIIENDIGATSAHVIMIHVDGLRVSITATDAHLRRLEFLQRSVTGFDVRWTDPRTRRLAELEDTDVFYESVGTFIARDRDELSHFLAHVGARLVFLIDWNRARKALAAFVPKRAAVALLAGAATDGYGHRGLLEMGGEQLIFDAMASEIRTPLRYGERLDDVLGESEACEFLRFALRVCGDGLRGGQTRALLRRQIYAELARLVRSRGERLLEPIAEHASLLVELARDVRAQLGGGDEERVAHAAKEREHRADEIVAFVRSVVERRPGAEGWRRVIEHADDAADALEEAAFLTSLLAEPLPERPSITRVAELASSAVELYNRAVESAHRAGSEALQETLEAVDGITTLEHEMDVAERGAAHALVRSDTVDRKLFVVAWRICAECERAVDAITHAAFVLRACRTSTP